MYASEHGHLDVVEMLLATQKINVNGVCVYCETPLTRAARRGHFSVVKRLLEEKGVHIATYVVAGCMDSKTVLSYASEFGRDAFIPRLQMWPYPGCCAPPDGRES